MTPAAQYAQKREEAVELIRGHAPPRLQDSLIELLRPAIALSATRANESEIPLGASKFGGAPDVPPNFEWPMWNDKPLGFLAQINLEEVAPFDVENLLPKNGLLSFFYDFEEEPWGELAQHEGWRVYHFSDALWSKFSAPEGSQGDFSTATISSFITLSVPLHLRELVGRDYRDYSKAEWTQWTNWQKASRYLHPDGRQHRLLGHPIETQDDARYQAATITERGDWQDWQLLFQFDEGDGSSDFIRDDLRALFFLIYKSDLQAHDFSRVWCIAA